ncbi:lipoprotein [Sphaerotilus microaerophilus]|uniref:Lipoprotein n=1 Tax=Sphaerotilus microaerophilus TaxID=2914710 RepID=A0ABM7YQK9_9BURK|nr:lipoprotein [Sphaerotilus sp. FB-5]
MKLPLPETTRTGPTGTGRHSVLSGRAGRVAGLACALAVWSGTAWPLAPAPPAVDCRALSPWPTLPAATATGRHPVIDVTRYGARPDDDQPDDAGVERALQAAQPGDWIVFPPGRYLQKRSWLFTVPGVTLWGPGARVHALDPADQTFGLRADGLRMFGFTLTAATDHRRTQLNNERVTIAPGRAPTRASPPVRHVLVRGITIEPEAGAPFAASAAGIFVYHASHFTIAENHIRATLADGIHITDGSRVGRVIGNQVSQTGDDAIATVTYLGDEGLARLRKGLEADPERQVRDILIEANTVGGNAWGRGIGVIGSERITVRGNLIRGVELAAGIIVAQEGVYKTPGARDVLIEGNQIRDIQVAGQAADPARRRARTGHAGIEIHAYANPPGDAADPFVAERLRVRNVLVRNNQIDNTGAGGIRVGAQSAPGLIERIRLENNTLRRTSGDPVQLHAPDSVTRSCANGMNGTAGANGASASTGCPPAEVDEVPAGARVDCTTLP